LTASESTPEWMAIWGLCHELTNDVHDNSLLDISIPVWVLFGLTSLLRLQVRDGSMQFDPDAVIVQMLQKAIVDRQELRVDVPATLLAEDVEHRLKGAGFVRNVTPQQARNVASLLRFTAAADFSVPGAGKTTEALAYFALKRKTGDRLLVVAPVNAFGPWEEQIELCFGVGIFKVVRLVENVNAIGECLKSLPDIALINYHKLAQPGTHAVVANFIASQRSFVFLDESHKIKRGEDGAWGNAVLSVAHIPSFKLVMSGTPMPNATIDLVAQMKFLHPESDVDEQDVTKLIQPIFVRTTKAELGLPPVSRRIVEIPLGAGQRQMYQMMSTTLAQEIQTAFSNRDRGSVRRMGRSVLKLLKFVSNPALLIPDLQYTDAASLRDVLIDEDSKKVEYAVMRARQLAQQGRKCIIWSSFVDNIEIISGRLEDLGAAYIHGGIHIGSEDDDTRERRIKQFHEDSNRYVLVANPAAAGEAISLHTVCHNAIYVDRTYNAAQFLQSEDRIHRVGLPADTVTEVEILVAANTVDESVNRRLIRKVELMGEVLNDPHLRIDPNYEDPEENDEIVDADLEDFVKEVDATG
jgi:SNF2 family DNA or RNA helicase